MKLSLVKCEIKDLDDLIRISKSTFEAAFEHLNDPRDFRSYIQKAFSRDNLEMELSNPNSFFYFVNCENELAGYFKINKAGAQTDINDNYSLEIERIYVVKEFQGRQIGQWMISEIKSLASQEGIEYLWLGVWELNEGAIRFYRKNGFYKFGEHPYFIGKDRQTDWLLCCDIATLQA